MQRKKNKQRHSILSRSQLLGIILIYAFFLLTLPSLNELITPCLKHIPGTSYAYADCNVGLSLDHYITIAIIGMGAMILLVFIKTIQSGYKTLVALALVFTLLTIGGYYLYIPKVEAGIRNSPLVLESLLKR